jgi:molecular chaperone GrpE
MPETGMEDELPGAELESRTTNGPPTVDVQADGGDAGEDPAGTIADDRTSDLERELTLERDKLLRLAAEFDNYRKRMLRERLEAEERGKAELVKKILEPLDDISRFAHVDPAVTESETVVQGVEMVERKLEKILRDAGLEIINPTDEVFDPSLHEAVTTEPTESPELDHTVARVFQVGYRFKGQLLRPARVVVRQYPHDR